MSWPDFLLLVIKVAGGLGFAYLVLVGSRTPAPSPDQEARTRAPREADGAGIPPCCEQLPDGTYRSPIDL